MPILHPFKRSHRLRCLSSLRTARTGLSSPWRYRNRAAASVAIHCRASHGWARCVQGRDARCGR